MRPSQTRNRVPRRRVQAPTWVDDDEDRRLMEMEDMRGVEQAPVGSGFR